MPRDEIGLLRNGFLLKQKQKLCYCKEGNQACKQGRFKQRYPGRVSIEKKGYARHDDTACIMMTDASINVFFFWISSSST